MKGRTHRLLVASLLVAACAGLVRTAGEPEEAPIVEASRSIDLNSATIDELMLLPRIGPVLAQRIVDDRAENGPFEEVDDLQRVRGIGPKTVQGLRGSAIARPLER